MMSPWKVASVLALMATQPVWGCGGDYECEPYLALQGDGLDCEVQSLPFLSPNNDLGTNLALVGTNTYGKPVGQYGFDLSECDDRLRAVTFKTTNAEDQGD